LAKVDGNHNFAAAKRAWVLGFKILKIRIYLRPKIFFASKGGGEHDPVRICQAGHDYRGDGEDRRG
jgi:hypothetical protein